MWGVNGTSKMSCGTIPPVFWDNYPTCAPHGAPQGNCSPGGGVPSYVHLPPLMRAPIPPPTPPPFHHFQMGRVRRCWKFFRTMRHIHIHISTSSMPVPNPLTTTIPAQWCVSGLSSGGPGQSHGCQAR